MAEVVYIDENRNTRLMAQIELADFQSIELAVAASYGQATEHMDGTRVVVIGDVHGDANSFIDEYPGVRFISHYSGQEPNLDVRCDHHIQKNSDLEDFANCVKKALVEPVPESPVPQQKAEY